MVNETVISTIFTVMDKTACLWRFCTFIRNEEDDQKSGSRPVISPMSGQKCTFPYRWPLVIACAACLHDKAGTMRFSDLCKTIPDVSQKMLTSTLRKLEADDLLSRTVYPEVPPRVEYKLTKRGKTLIPLLNQLVDWSLDNMDAIIRHRKKYAL